MVGSVGKNDLISKTLKLYILRNREQQRQEDEAEVEKQRKKKEQDDKKLKEETEFKATKDKITELTKVYDHMKSEKARVFEHLKKILFESNKYRLEVDDIAKLYEIGLAVPTHISTIAGHQPVHVSSCIQSSIIPPRPPGLSVNAQYKTSSSTVLPVQTLPTSKRNRSPSPVYRSAYSYKQPTGPHPFQKLDDASRNHEYSRSYLYAKSGNVPASSNFSAFYPPGQNVTYTHPSQSVHSNTGVYNSYNTNRDNVEAMHKSHSPTAAPSTTSSQHSLFNHRSPVPSGPSSSVPSNHIYHPKDRNAYSDDKYYMVRPGTHLPVHGVLSIQQSQNVKHGSITSGYPIRPVATQINPQPPLHIGGHHSSPSSHLSSLSSHHSTQSHQSHHQSGAILYPPSHHSQTHSSSQSSQSPQQSSHHTSHQQHIQQLHVPSHHPSANSHHQLLSHHSTPSIHHSSNQSHLQSTMHHSVPHHAPSLHHQPHIQHISSHPSSSQHTQGQQSQSTSVVTSQAYANQISAIQGGNRVVFSQPPH